MGVTEKARGGWRRFRSWPAWAQALTAVVLVGVVIAAGASGGEDDESATATTTTTTTVATTTTTEAEEGRPGNPTVYQRIETTEDCTVLQDEFDTAMENVERYPAGSPQRDVPMEYAEAADERMRDLGCY